MTFVSENRDWLEPYFYSLADALRLGHYEIELLDRDDLADWSIADSQSRVNYEIARIRIRAHDNNGGIIRTPEELRTIIVHELIHVHLGWLDNVDDELKQYVPGPVWGVYADYYNRTMERCVDALAMGVAKHLPLPPLDECWRAIDRLRELGHEHD